MTPAPKTRRSMFLWLTLVAVLVLGAVLIVSLGLTVDDWSRDLSTNHATTLEGHADPGLRPLWLVETPEQIAVRLEQVVGKLPRWKVESRADTPDGVDYHLVRTTLLWKFADDVRVSIRREGNRSVVRAESRSRVGKGDLGQNPRNLRELLDTLRAPTP